MPDSSFRHAVAASTAACPEAQPATTLYTVRPTSLPSTLGHLLPFHLTTSLSTPHERRLDCLAKRKHTSESPPSAVKMTGFDFSNYNRNAALHARGVPLPKATSTGTTIVGCIFDGGVVVRPLRAVAAISTRSLVPAPVAAAAGTSQRVHAFPANRRAFVLTHPSFTTYRSQPIPVPRQAPLSPTRTARSCITSRRRSGARAPALPPTPSSRQR